MDAQFLVHKEDALAEAQRFFGRGGIALGQAVDVHRCARIEVEYSYDLQKIAYPLVQ